MLGAAHILEVTTALRPGQVDAVMIDRTDAGPADGEPGHCVTTADLLTATVADRAHLGRECSRPGWPWA